MHLNILQKNSFAQKLACTNQSGEKVSHSSLYCNYKICQEYVRRKTIVRLKTELNVSDSEMKKHFLLPFKTLSGTMSRDFGEM